MEKLETTVDDAKLLQAMEKIETTVDDAKTYHLRRKIRQLESLVEVRDAQIVEMGSLLREREEEIEDLMFLVKQKQVEIQSFHKQISEKVSKALGNNNSDIETRRDVAEHRAFLLSERCLEQEKLINSLKIELSELKAHRSEIVVSPSPPIDETSLNVVKLTEKKQVLSALDTARAREKEYNEKKKKTRCSNVFDSSYLWR
eukprot:g2379.t1